jgi:hypothetical protein
MKTFRHNVIVHWGDTDPGLERTSGHTPLYIPHYGLNSSVPE